MLIQWLPTRNLSACLFRERSIRSWLVRPFFVFVLATGGLLGTTFTAPGAHAADWLYTIRPGDKLWNLADKYCGAYTYWRDIAKHNNLSQPTRLQPGTRLRIPIEWLIEVPAAVELIYTLGDVQYIRAQNQSTTVGQPIARQPIARGSTLMVGDTLITGPESYANVRFADGSVMQVGPESELVFDTLSAYRDTGMVDSRVRLNRGSSSSEVKKQTGPGSKYRISTPLGVAAVRGTEFRTRAEAGDSFVETVGGAVEYVSGSANTPVTKGYGLKASNQGVMVEELLEAPSFVSSATRPHAGNESLRWTGVAGAAEYLVQVYSSPDLSSILTGAKVPGPEYALASLVPGNYVFGVRGIAASGLQGYEATQAITVRPTLAAPAGLRVWQPGRSSELRVQWDAVDGASDYRVVVTPTGGGAAIVETTESSELLVQNLPRETYTVSVQALDGEIESAAAPAQEQTVRRRSPWGIGGMVLALLLAI